MRKGTFSLQIRKILVTFGIFLLSLMIGSGGALVYGGEKEVRIVATKKSRSEAKKKKKKLKKAKKKGKRNGKKKARKKKAENKKKRIKKNRKKSRNKRNKRNKRKKGSMKEDKKMDLKIEPEVEKMPEPDEFKPEEGKKEKEKEDSGILFPLITETRIPSKDFAIFNEKTNKLGELVFEPGDTVELPRSALIGKKATGETAGEEIELRFEETSSYKKVLSAVKGEYKLTAQTMKEFEINGVVYRDLLFEITVRVR